MRLKLIIVFSLIIVIPIIGLSWLGVKTIRDQQEIVKHRIGELIEQKLRSVDDQIAKLVKKYERTVYAFYHLNDYSVYRMRSLVKNNAEINNFLVLDRGGRQVFPSPYYTNPREREFLHRSRQFLKLFGRRKLTYRWISSKSISVAKTKRGFYLQQRIILSKKRAYKRAPQKTAKNIPRYLSYQVKKQLEHERRKNYIYREKLAAKKQELKKKYAYRKKLAARKRELEVKRNLAEQRTLAMRKEGINALAGNKTGRLNDKKASPPKPGSKPVIARIEKNTGSFSSGGVRSQPSGIAKSDAQSEADAAIRKDVPKKSQAKGTRLNRGWSIWFWENGINLIYWYRNRYGYLIAAEISRVKLKSDIISLLPATEPQIDHQNESLITLTDARGSVIYQWGRYKPPTSERPLKTLDLSLPLNAWTLNYYAPALVLKGAVGYLPILLGMSTAILVMVGLAYYFYRENNRELAVAQQRVTFVNQVSHELKTPLTNIRMYAELLEDEIDHIDEEENGSIRNRVDVIVNESQRLSRLINNVLSFARNQRGKLNLVKSLNRVDDIIDSVVQQFRPALTSKKIEIDIRKNTGTDVYIDADVVEQILHNLINNIEKYAAGGRYLGIESSQPDNDTVTIVIQDHGPGIPRTVSEKIFEDFFRIDNKLTEGVSGTGIGLSISRELARLHGGDLCLKKSDQGACFVLTLNVGKET